MSVTRCLATILVAALALTFSPPSVAATSFGPQLPDNPHDGPTGSAAMHGDSAASDTTPLAGPGTGHILAKPIVLGAACPTILVGSDGLPVALCTQIINRSPKVFLLDKPDRASDREPRRGVGQSAGRRVRLPGPGQPAYSCRR